jgi:Xaa-Pro aminopeptidase
MKLSIPDAQAFLMVSESEHNADMYYASGFLAYDSFIYLNSGEEKILISDMELGRASKESKVHEVIPTSRFNIMEKIRINKDADAAYCELIIK